MTLKQQKAEAGWLNSFHTWNRDPHGLQRFILVAWWCLRRASDNWTIASCSKFMKEPSMLVMSSSGTRQHPLLSTNEWSQQLESTNKVKSGNDKATIPSQTGNWSQYQVNTNLDKAVK